MKTLFLTWLLALPLVSVLAQTSSYTFIREGGQISYLDIADTTVTEHTVADDLVLPAKVNLGFSFKFNGAFYDSIGISENGYIWFGPARAEDMAGVINPITDSLPAGVKGVVCAFGVDLHPHINTSFTTTIRSRTFTSAGQPWDFIVEWRNTSRLEALNDPAGEDTLGFQIQLFALEEDRVQITYGFDIGINPNVSSELSVGMRGESKTDFALRSTDGGHTWDNTIAGNTLEATCTFNRANNPGQVAHNYMSWVNRSNPNEVNGPRNLSFSIYPVPAGEKMYVACEETAIISCQIYTLQGALVNVPFRDSALETAELPAGIYLLRIQTSEGVFTRKVVKK